MRFKLLMILTLSLAALGLEWVTGCTKKILPVVPTNLPGGSFFTPTATETTTPTVTVTQTLEPPHETPTVSVPPTGIYILIGTSNAFATSVGLAVNGAPETTATITLTTPQGTIPIPYYSGNPPSSLAPYFSNSGSSLNSYYYQAGFTYTLTAVTSLGTITASVEAPGGAVSIAADGSLITWPYEGNEDYLTVFQGSPVPADATYRSYDTVEDIDSPFSIPNSAYPATGYVYTLALAAQTTIYNIAGTAAGSRWTITDNWSATISK